ncbi:hypothetical protein BC832DRAFT_589124 [Gaertneriomyces semiglobifer]|nr:hypothetical protein BC832DRAFT_589124 [Gaertneriomyces semiglobifer]
MRTTPGVPFTLDGPDSLPEAYLLTVFFAFYRPDEDRFPIPINAELYTYKHLQRYSRTCRIDDPEALTVRALQMTLRVEAEQIFRLESPSLAVRLHPVAIRTAEGSVVPLDIPVVEAFGEFDCVQVVLAAVADRQDSATPSPVHSRTAKRRRNDDYSRHATYGLESCAPKTKRSRSECDIQLSFDRTQNAGRAHIALATTEHIRSPSANNVGPGGRERKSVLSGNPVPHDATQDALADRDIIKFSFCEGSESELELSQISACSFVSGDGNRVYEPEVKRGNESADTAPLKSDSKLPAADCTKNLRHPHFFTVSLADSVISSCLTNIRISHDDAERTVRDRALSDELLDVINDGFLFEGRRPDVQATPAGPGMPAQMAPDLWDQVLHCKLVDETATTSEISANYQPNSPGELPRSVNNTGSTCDDALNERFEHLDTTQEHLDTTQGILSADVTPSNAGNGKPQVYDIIDDRTYRGRRQYKVHPVGRSSSEDRWILGANITNKRAIRAYLQAKRGEAPEVSAIRSPNESDHSLNPARADNSRGTSPVVPQRSRRDTESHYNASESDAEAAVQLRNRAQRGRLKRRRKQQREKQRLATLERAAIEEIKLAKRTEAVEAECNALARQCESLKESIRLLDTLREERLQAAYLLRVARTNMAICIEEQRKWMDELRSLAVTHGLSRMTEMLQKVMSKPSAVSPTVFTSVVGSA